MMRRLSSMHGLLRNECEEISMMALRSSPGDVFDQVMLGKTYIVTRQGKQLAAIVPLPNEALTMVIGPDGKVTYKAAS